MHRDVKPTTGPSITYILTSFPDGVEPFVFNELKELSRQGFDIRVFSVYGAPRYSDDYYDWTPRTVYAEPLFSLRIVLAHLYFIFTKPSTYWSLLRRYKSFRGKKVFLKSVFFSRRVIEEGISHVHAHFAWGATDAARLVSKLTGISYSVTAHQSDINRNADSNLQDKLTDARLIITCTKGNREYLGERFGKDIYDKTTAVYHGVDIEKFQSTGRCSSPRVDIISVGGLIKVKGFDYLLRACAILKARGITCKCLIIGKGPEKVHLEKLILDLDLGGRVEIANPVRHEDIVEFYDSAKLFVLPVVRIDGAPHGIPNVLAEAMSMGLPVISTRVPDIPELIEDGRDGQLVNEKDPEAIADAIENLLRDNGKRSSLGKMARKRIEKEFDARKHIQRIAEIFLNCRTSQ